MPFVPTLNPENTVPRGVFEGTGQRAFLHNLVANPDLAKKYLRSLGDEVVEYGKGWDFAFRTRGSNGPYVPAESHTFGGWILNHIADAVIGVGTGVAATLGAGAAAETGPGAIAAGAAAGALASGALEAGRQFVGHLAGVPDNLDTGQIAAATAGGALAEPLGAAGGAVVRGTGRALGFGIRKSGQGLAEVAAKLADVEALGSSGVASRTAGQVLIKGAALTRGGRVPLIDPERAGGILRNAVRWINRVKFPEIIKADEMTSAAGVEFDLSHAMGTILERTRRTAAQALQVERINDPTISKKAAELLDAITEVTGFSGDWAHTPGQIAVTIRRALQGEAEGAGAFEGAGLSVKRSPWGKVLKSAAARTRLAIEQGMEPVQPGFSALMKSAYDKLTVLGSFNRKLRIADFSMAGDDAAVKFVRGVYGENRIAYLKALNDLDAHFSTGRRGRLVDRAIASIRQANIGAAIGNRGLGELLPHMTSGGRVRSAGAMIGLSYLAGGPLGAVTAGVASSPKFILRAVGPVSRAGAAAQSVTGALARVHLGGASRVIAVGTVDAASVAAMREVIRQEGGGSKPLARQEEGKRRRILIGE